MCPPDVAPQQLVLQIGMLVLLAACGSSHPDLAPPSDASSQPDDGKVDDTSSPDSSDSSDSSCSCTTPPATTCLDVATLRTYEAAGTCTAGSCTYAHTDEECSIGCRNGACVPAPSGITSLTSNISHSCITKGGAVACWGVSFTSTATTIRYTAEAYAPMSSGVRTVRSGGLADYAIMQGGGLKSWGINQYGQLGNGSTLASDAPVDVSGLTAGVASVAPSLEFACALTTTGGVMCWGANDEGQLGTGTTPGSFTPVGVLGLQANVTAVASGNRHACALTTAGGVKCWGANASGQLGNGSTTTSFVPVDVVGLSSVVRIAAGFRHTCALKSNGTIACWGSNSAGQLGRGNLVSSAVPVTVSGITQAVAISLGMEHSCSLSSFGGGVMCWGSNERGQLGQSTNVTLYNADPVDVTNLTTGVLAISAGFDFNCAITTVGEVRCWGRGDQGQLGYAFGTDSVSPVKVLGL